MGTSLSLLLIAVGAVLAFAVDVTAEGVNLNTVGDILLIVGGLGLLLSLFFLNRVSSDWKEDQN